MARALRAWAINQREKTRSVTYSTDLGVLKTRSNLAAKSKVQLTASFKFLGGGGGVSWLVACKSNKYEVIVHGQNNSLDLFIGGLLKEISTCWVRQKGFHGI